MTPVTRGRALLGSALAALGAAACVPSGPLPGASDAASAYRAEIRRTAYGIPHVVAGDYGSLGFGAAYAGAEQNVCLIAELHLTVAAERARFFGPGDGNLESDLLHQLWIDEGNAEEPGLSPENRAFLRGTAAGYDHYLRETGVDALPDARCRGAAWVRPVEEIGVRRLQRTSQFAVAMLPLLVAAAPPGATAAAALPAGPAPAFGAQGSNAIALGSEVTEHGRGMFLGNPHQPWHGSFRFTLKHLTIPGVLDVMGASPVGLANAGVGYTEWLAWNGTVSTAQRMSFYRLELVPGRPTAYRFDGETREMRRREVAVVVRTPDGGLEERRHTFYATHFGPLVESQAFPWTQQHAYALRQVDPGWRTSNEILEVQRARSVREAKAILDRHQGWPVNFIAADATGEVLFADPGPVAHLGDAQLAACAVPRGLDGTRSACQWGSDADAAVPGILGPAALPHLFRRDFVANSNSSHWLTHPAAPLEGFPRVVGDERSERSLRTRHTLTLLAEALDPAAGGDGAISLAELRTLFYSNRDHAGELLRDELVALCRAHPAVDLDDGARVELGPACDALSRWDLRVDLASRGAHLFREFLKEGGAVFAVLFDPARPVATPRGLARDDPRVLRALGAAVRRLDEAGLALDAPLGEVQYVVRAGERIPIHGGDRESGTFNQIRAPFGGPAGYPEVQSGSSFVLAVEFTDDGPVGFGFVTTSQSIDPGSPHHADMTRLFSRKGWVRLPFRADDALADPASATRQVEAPRAPR